MKSEFQVIVEKLFKEYSFKEGQRFDVDLAVGKIMSQKIDMIRQRLSLLENDELRQKKISRAKKRLAFLEQSLRECPRRMGAAIR